MSLLSARQSRNLARLIPFALIWLFTGWVFLLVEAAPTGNQNLNPDEAITLTLPVFIFASIAVAVVGLIIGAVELFLFEKRFTQYSLVAKIVYKLLIYLILLLVIILISYPIAASLELEVPITDPSVWNKLRQYHVSIIFASTMVQLAFSLLLSLLYAAISENLGHNVLIHIFTGRYHQPIVENRIFMFIDMKSSTTIAEALGHLKYFELLKEYYTSMSDAIVDHRGEVYQYIGDEVVISWKSETGISNTNCLRCFFDIKRHMETRRKVFEERFGVFPQFKAGVHIGEVTTGEVAALKKEIVFTGDVLNTTARVQGLCNKFNAELIITGELKDCLGNLTGLQLEPLGTIELAGKSESKTLFSVNSTAETY
ncbi:MAG: adenylate/guanylate cyclase domain-containing protein [Cyclobacteriaceae bacterium]